MLDQEKLTTDVLQVKEAFFKIAFPHIGDYTDKALFYVGKAQELLPPEAKTEDIRPYVRAYLEGDYSPDALEWFEEDAEVYGCLAIFVLAYFVSLNLAEKISKAELLFCEAVVAGLLYMEDLTQLLP